MILPTSATPSSPKLQAAAELTLIPATVVAVELLAMAEQIGDLSLGSGGWPGYATGSGT